MKNYSIWQNSINNLKKKSIDENMVVDILIVGGGITGISTLVNLINSKYKTVLIEKNRCGSGTTSRSTAKITYLQGDTYINIRKTLDNKIALEYLNSQVLAVNLLKDLIIKNKIDCDLEKVDAYLFTLEEENLEKLEEEYKFFKDNNLEIEKVTNVMFDKNVKMALKIKDSYVFNPIKYINYWVDKYKDYIYENSKLEGFRKVNGYYECIVNGKIIKTKYLVMASHYPYFLIPLGLPFKNYIETSYIGVKKSTNKKFSAISIDKPCISIRYYNNNLIYLNNSLKSANIKDINKNFDYFKNNFDYIWSNNDLITNDYLPFIGRIEDNLFLATGYNTWGMTNGVLAGYIIKDLILEKQNKYEELFNPTRGLNLHKLGRVFTDLYSNIKAFTKSNKNNVNNKSVINKTIKGKKVLIYKDNNKEYIVLNRCPHLKCGIVFNETEKVWECLCHGSRFTLDGKCINGPSNFDITFK